MLKKCRGSYARFYRSQVLAIYDSIFLITLKNILPATPITELASKLGRTSGLLQVMHKLSSLREVQAAANVRYIFLTIIGNGTTLGKEPVNLSNNHGAHSSDGLVNVVRRDSMSGSRDTSSA
jgi:hypothetical protein